MLSASAALLHERFKTVQLSAKHPEYQSCRLVGGIALDPATTLINAAQVIGLKWFIVKIIRF